MNEDPESEGPTSEARPRRMAAWKKVVLILGGSLVFGFVGLVVVVQAALTVGYLNLMVSYGYLGDVAEQAMRYPLEGRAGALVEMGDDGLEEARFGSIDIRQLGPGVRCVTIDRGGGHLGVQGYVYFPDAQGDGHVHEAVFGGFEGRAAWHLIGGWYAYDSTEE